MNLKITGGQYGSPKEGGFKMYIKVEELLHEARKNGLLWHVTNNGAELKKIIAKLPVYDIKQPKQTKKKVEK